MPNETLLLAPPPVPKRITRGTAFGCPRDFLDHRLVYAVISPRARGLSLGVNMNPDGHCNFDCAYCEVHRRAVQTPSLPSDGGVAMSADDATAHENLNGRPTVLPLLGERAGVRANVSSIFTVEGRGEEDRCFLESPLSSVLSPLVPRGERKKIAPVDVEVMADELQKTLDLVWSGEIKQRSFFSGVPDELLQLRHVALSGDGEPTLCLNFTEVVQTVMYVRARSHAFFKVVLITNATGLDRPEIQEGLKCLTRADEIWAKLDAGTQAYMIKVNGPDARLDNVMANILSVSRQRPVIIQSLFPSLNGQEPPPEEIAQYAERLKELKEAGAQIPLVQIYSATRPTPHSECGHLPLKTLSNIAQTVRKVAGLEAEIF